MSLVKDDELSDRKIRSYIRRAEVVASNSPDEQTKVGAVLVSWKTHSVISEGYNGFIRGADDSKLPKTRPAKHDFVIHAEQNLLYNAARNGVQTDDCFVVQTISPCVHCARALYQAGISVVYFKDWYQGHTSMKNYDDLKFDCTTYQSYTKIVIKPNKD